MATFTTIIIIAFAILQIILFFKLWGMTNDVNDIKQLMLNMYSGKNLINEKSTEYIGDETDGQPKDYDIRLDSLHEGDRVGIIGSPRVLTVMYVDSDRILCKTSILGGGDYFPKKKLRYIGK